MIRFHTPDLTITLPEYSIHLKKDQEPRGSLEEMREFVK